MRLQILVVIFQADCYPLFEQSGELTDRLTCEIRLTPPQQEARDAESLQKEAEYSCEDFIARTGNKTQMVSPVREVHRYYVPAEPSALSR